MSSRILFIVFLLGSVTLVASNMTFSVSSTGTLAVPMESPSVVALTGGDALVFGDAAGSVPERYDASTGSFFLLSPIANPLADAAGVRLTDGRVFIAGGIDGGYA